MNKWQLKISALLITFILTTCILLVQTSVAQNRVVVIPLGDSATGNATPSDVVKGKTFSNRTANGLTGVLDIRDGVRLYTNSIGMNFSLIPSGSFVMGSPDGTGDASHRPVWPAETGRQGLEDQHIVIISKPFYLQTTEVTQGQWKKVMGSNPSYFSSCGLNCPVENVSWYDVQNFIDALNTLEGRRNCNTEPNNCYRLPTEAEWEYAARAGTLTAFYNGDITVPTGCDTIDPNLDAIGWYCGNAEGTTHPVAQKEPNNWGLYDMSGNVYEWCNDVIDTYVDGPVTDPVGTSGTRPVVRGGAYNSPALIARSANRLGEQPSFKFSFFGFRLVLLILP